jgi:hypothetical protein
VARTDARLSRLADEGCLATDVKFARRSLLALHRKSEIARDLDLLSNEHFDGAREN